MELQSYLLHKMMHSPHNISPTTVYKSSLQNMYYYTVYPVVIKGIIFCIWLLIRILGFYFWILLVYFYGTYHHQRQNSRIKVLHRQSSLYRIHEKYTPQNLPCTQYGIAILNKSMNHWTYMHVCHTLAIHKYLPYSIHMYMMVYNIE